MVCSLTLVMMGCIKKDGVKIVRVGGFFSMHGKRSVYFLNTHYHEFSLLIPREQLVCWCYSVVTLLLYFVDGEQGLGLDSFESLL